jgi:hypothetical protein
MTTPSQSTAHAQARRSADLDFRIDPLQPTDWPQVAAIHAEGIATGNATLETAPPT